MGAVVLFEFAAGAADIRSALLDRIGPLALSGDGRLSFAGTERGEAGRSGIDIVAVGFRNADIAESVLARWRVDPAFPSGLRVRSLRLDPVWSIEPLALMFP